MQHRVGRLIVANTAIRHAAMQVMQADKHTVCLRLRTSTETVPQMQVRDEGLATTSHAKNEKGQNAKGGAKAESVDNRHYNQPWPWTQLPPGSNRGGRSLNMCDETGGTRI